MLLDAPNEYWPATMERGEWKPTPRIWQWFGYPAYRRPVYAYANIGGGIDGYEYRALSRKGEQDG